MSTTVAREVEAPRVTPLPQVKCSAHSALIYWWPVWAMGFILAGWTALGDHHVALVPAGSTVDGNVVAAPEGSNPLLTGVHLTRSSVPGVLFVATILAVLVLRGGWLTERRAITLLTGSALVAGFVSVLDGWGPVASGAAYLGIYLNLGAYLVLSTGLFVLWMIHFFVLDRRSYVIITSEGVRLREGPDAPELTFPREEVSLEAEPYDWFRWLIGFGAGRVAVRVGDRRLELANVPRAGQRVAAARALVRETATR